MGEVTKIKGRRVPRKWPTKEWEKKADNLARSFIEIKSCADCGGPYVPRYCCTQCGSKYPDEGTPPEAE